MKYHRPRLTEEELKILIHILEKDFDYFRDWRRRERKEIKEGKQPNPYKLEEIEGYIKERKRLLRKLHKLVGWRTKYL